MPKKAPITASAQRLVWQRKIDDIGDRIKQKLEVMSGFKDVGGQLKKMQDFLAFFDKSGTGYLNFERICIALKKLNFLGCSRELEAFFNYYDDDCTGTVNYAQMSKEIYGQCGDGRPLFDFTSTGIIEKVRNSVADVGGASGFFHISKRVRANSTNGKISRMGLQDSLQEYGVGPDAVSTAELTLLCNAFDPLHENVINSAHFLQSLIKGTMSYERKLIVRQTFMRFNGAQEMGYVSVNDLVQHFDPAYHPEVIAELLSAQDACLQFRQSFSQGEESEGYVTLAEYLDYFKGVSLAVTNDHAFDMMMRNIIMFQLDGSSGGGFDESMSTSFSSPTLRRLLVTHSNGNQEVVEVLDEMGMGRFDVSSAKDRAREMGVTDIASIRL